MTTLYVVEPGARIEKEYQRLLVTKDDEILLRVPMQHVTQVVLVGQVGVTTPALHALLQANVSLFLVSRTGSLLGRLTPPTPANLPLRQAQYRRNDDPTFTIGLARAIVAGKIRNQRILAQRIARRHAELHAASLLDDLAQAGEKAWQAASLEHLLGIEGQAARQYFAIYRQAFDPAWTFKTRNRRPPKDPVNALLSLGYTFLGHAMMAALEVAGMDPYLGFFHAEKYGRPALALDLVEEFRAPLVDSLVLSLVNRRVLAQEDFEQGPQGEGVYLTSAGLRAFLSRFSRLLESEIKIPALGRTLSYRKLFEVQARQLAHLVLGEREAYTPFRAR